MPPTLNSPNATPGWTRLAGLALPATLIGSILVFIVPVPPAVLDLLLAINITLAVVILLTTLSIRAPHEFAAFPTIILTTTLTRLVLNVATTRLVLTSGGVSGMDAAGGVIRAFGEFVVGGLCRRRGDPVRDPGRDSVHGHHQGGDPDQRGDTRSASGEPAGTWSKLARFELVESRGTPPSP